MDPDDTTRVAEIEAYGVVGNPPRRDLQALVELAAQLVGVPSAAINLITASEQVQVATYGIHPSVCSREDSMCAAILHEAAPVVVADASRDDRFRENPFVTGVIADVRFYAANQLVTPDGVAIGTLCVFDDAPREISDRQRQGLRTLADRVVDVLELGLRTGQLERSLRRLTVVRDELRRSNEQLAVFAGQVSHDLRNPLTSVSMSLQMLQEQPTVMEDDDTLWMVDRALSGAQRMDGLIEELLDYARLGGGLRTTPVDLAEVLGEVRDDLAARLADADLEVGELPVLCGDRAQLRAVLQNLVDNALKFAAPDRRARVTVTAATTPEGWLVEVADNGPGVPKEDRERVFDLLTRRDKSIEGAGIGLATCRRVVWAHGGTIEMDESPDGGALVRIMLPRAG
ncbi:MAG: sensor histidine kinase [Nocardioidaceae bacterium]